MTKILNFNQLSKNQCCKIKTNFKKYIDTDKKGSYALLSEEPINFPVHIKHTCFNKSEKRFLTWRKTLLKEGMQGRSLKRTRPHLIQNDHTNLLLRLVISGNLTHVIPSAVTFVLLICG